MVTIHRNRAFKAVGKRSRKEQPLIRTIENRSCEARKKSQKKNLDPGDTFLQAKSSNNKDDTPIVHEERTSTSLKHNVPGGFNKTVMITDEGPKSQGAQDNQNQPKTASIVPEREGGSRERQVIA
jgi:hypothetical protein